MARCSCAGSTCSCSIKGGTGVTVTGAGSVASPYVIDANGSIEGALTVLDTPTVDLSLIGDGTEADPMILQATATLAMTQLTDWNDPAGPAEGEVPVWTTDHWEAKLAPTTPPGAVNVSDGLEGDGSAPDPIKVAVSGTWGAGDMEDFGPDTTQGTPVYVDVNSQVRARPIPVETYLNVFEYEDGWTNIAGGINRLVKWGQSCTAFLNIKRTGAAIPTNAYGNIGNVTVGNLKVGVPQPAPDSAGVGASGGDGGFIAGWRLTSVGVVQLGALPPAGAGFTGVPVGYEFIVVINYVTDEGAIMLPAVTLP